MRKHRFFVIDYLITNTIISLDKDLSHYINRVLRLNVGDEIYLFNNTNFEFKAIINAITRNNIDIKIIDKVGNDTPPGIHITLGQVLGKGDKMDLIIQKATELGASTIYPLFSERTVIRNIAERTEHKLEHWQKIAIAACGQSWRNTVPSIHAPQALQQWINQMPGGSKLILSPNSEAIHLRDLKPDTHYTVLIGPEGGFTDQEVALAIQHDFIPINLGPRILRTETAGLATIAALQALFGDG